ncbi:MAG: DUF1343 domain-containing protein [Balneolaceae bacterium]|nr:DUF1343 domain-containing protein [Balneolaceae bacterium]
MMFVIPILLFLVSACDSPKEKPVDKGRVQVGAEVLIRDHLDQLDGKRVGLVMNPTARIGDTHMLDTLMALEVDVAALFAPEHGFRGEAGAGEVIEDGVDQETGLPVYSLYGDTKKPTQAMLRNVDMLLFDMQDVGARFYTYNVTLGLVIEAAAEADIPVWVLDRPNPAGGDYVAGWTLEERHQSFVGAYPVPMAHGMTLGELARMMVGEQWLDIERRPELRVIRVEGWRRSMKWPDTGLPWHPPSPNLPTFEHAYIYLGTVLFEGTTLSEGRGTEDPFLTIGSPRTTITEVQLQAIRDRYPAVSIVPHTFTPKSIPGKARTPRYEGQQCHGLSLEVRRYDTLDPVEFGVSLLDLLLESTEGAETTEFIYKLAGTEQIDRRTTGWEESVRLFREKRRPYLLYE